MFVTTPTCCPSRASILTGQYAHNHGVLTNEPPDGGFPKFRASRGEGSTIATWLRAVGYRTAFLGKYLNFYPDDDLTYVPPGWDEWYGLIDEYKYYHYLLNENGQVLYPLEYQTDVLAAKALDFVKRVSQSAQPFFLYLALVAPHLPAQPAQRHRQAFSDISLPRPPSFDEADVSDKPAWIRRLPLLDASEIFLLDVVQRNRLRSLLAVDEAIEQLVNVLHAGGKLDDTVILFTSDNGFHLGEHRISTQKRTPYEESIRVPLLVRGPGMAQGRTLGHMVLNIDLAPTLAELGGAAGAEAADGRSLVPLLGSNPPPLEEWRQDFLLEHWGSDADNARLQIPDYHGLRTQDALFVKYQTGELELYDLRADPFQLESLHRRANPALLKRLSARLDALKRCAAATCRAVEARPEDRVHWEGGLLLGVLALGLLFVLLRHRKKLKARGDLP